MDLIRNRGNEDGPFAELTRAIIGAAVEVHRLVGPGLFESAYEECMCHELGLRRVRFERQVPVPLVYKDLFIECAYRADLVVEDEVVVEIKASEIMPPLAEAQLLTYLRMTRKRVGLLLNFDVRLMKHGIMRRVL